MAKMTVVWRKSAIGYNQDQKDTIRRLGLRRLNQSLEIEDTPTHRGMVNKVQHLVEIQEGSGK
ncbi:MAG: 50S ribosomal protein L30 [Dehalococcoidia bacterium]|jgi:large subunit ribosomal protein L30